MIIPKLEELKPDYSRDDKEFYAVCDVVDFYIENNNLIYPLNNHGGVNKIRCIKNYDNKYKIFAYKTLGLLSHTKYFLLDTNENKLYRYCGGYDATSKILEDWVEYLLSGGSYEKALEENKLDYDPFEGI